LTADFWVRTSGTWINVLTILAGTALGMGIRGRLPTRMQLIMTQGLGLTTLLIGIQMAGALTSAEAGPIDGIILGLLAIVIGGLLGEWWQIDLRLEALGNWLKTKFRGTGSFTEGFVAASLLFCVGPLTLIGSLNNGLTGDNTLLVLKSSMDGLAAIALASSFGLGVGFSSLVVIGYQGGVSLAAGLLAQVLPDPATDPHVLLMTGVGGLIVLGLGLNLLSVTHIHVASFLPGLVLGPIIYRLAIWITH
jgi:uncharacterized membrane protein YqgA involved in biofilm formation